MGGSLVFLVGTYENPKNLLLYQFSFELAVWRKTHRKLLRDVSTKISDSYRIILSYLVDLLKTFNRLARSKLSGVITCSLSGKTVENGKCLNMMPLLYGCSLPVLQVSWRHFTESHSDSSQKYHEIFYGICIYFLNICCVSKWTRLVSLWQGNSREMKLLWNCSWVIYAFILFKTCVVILLSGQVLMVLIRYLQLTAIPVNFKTMSTKTVFVSF